MNRPANRFLLKPISLAVAASILFPTTIANAQSNEEEVIEEDPFGEELEEIDYASMTVSQLKKLLKEKGLPVSGKKADLISRLEK